MAYDAADNVATYAAAVASDASRRQATRIPHAPQAGDADDASQCSSGNGSSVSMAALSTGVVHTPQSAAVPSAHAHTSSSPQAACAGPSAPSHSEPSSSVAQPHEDFGFQTVMSKQGKRALAKADAAARAADAATIGLSSALAPGQGGGDGAESLGPRQAGRWGSRHGGVTKSARQRSPKGGSATPSPEAKTARNG